MSAANTYGPFIDEYGIATATRGARASDAPYLPDPQRDPHHPECPKARGNDGD